MKRSLGLGVVTLVGLSLTGCGAKKVEVVHGNPAQGVVTSAPTRTQIPAQAPSPSTSLAQRPSPNAAKMLTLAAIEHAASMTGCDNNEAEFFARESGKCPFHGGDADIATFSSAANASQWLTTAKEYGGVFLVGDLWAAKLDSEGAAKTLQHIIGGSIQ